MLIAVVAALLALPGCGGDDDGDGVDKSNAEARLLVSQASSDILIFCRRARLESTGKDLQNTGLVSAGQAVDVLVDQRRKLDPTTEIPLSRTQPAVPLDKVVRDNLAKLERGCGADGKLLAVRLQRAASPG
jgi:hypothetical protein